MSRSDEDDDDAELQMLRAAALRSKRTCPDETISEMQQSIVSDIRPIEAVESMPSAVGQNAKTMPGHSRFPGNRVGIGRSNLIVIQTVPLDGEEQRPSKPLVRPSQSVPNLTRLITSSSAVLLRPQDKWDQNIISEPSKKKAPTNKFSRYNTDSSSDSDDEDEESGSDSDAEDAESRTLCRSEDESNEGNLVESSTVVYYPNEDDDALLANEAVVDINPDRRSPIFESPRPSPAIVVSASSATTMPDVVSSVDANSNLSIAKQISCIETVPVAKECPATESNSNPSEVRLRSQSVHSNWSDDSSLSRSPTPIRSPLRLIKNPGLPVSSHCRSPIRQNAWQTRAVNYVLSSPKAVNAAGSRSPYINQSRSPGQERSRVSPRGRRQLSPNRRRQSPVYHRSRSPSRPGYRSRSRSPDRRFRSRSPMRIQRRVMSPKEEFRSRSKSPVKYQSRLSPKDTKRMNSPYPNDRPKYPAMYQLKSSRHVLGRHRSRSPYYRVRSRSPVQLQSRLLPKATCRSKSKSQERVVRSQSPFVKEIRTSPKGQRRSRSRSAGKAIYSKTTTKGQSISPENTSRSPGSKLVSSSEQLRLPVQNQPQTYAYKLRPERQQMIPSDQVISKSPDVKQSKCSNRSWSKSWSKSPETRPERQQMKPSDKVISKSPDVMRSTCSKRSWSKSWSKSPERKPKRHDKSPVVDRGLQSRSGVTLLNKERKFRSSSPNRKLLPTINDCDISGKRLRLGSTERSRQDKSSLSRSSKSPMQKKSRVQNTRDIPASKSFRRNSPTRASKLNPMESGRVFRSKSKSPVKRCRAHSSEKLSKLSSSESAASGKRSRSKSLERCTGKPKSTMREEKLPDSSTESVRKHNSDKVRTGSSSQNTNPSFKLTSGNKFAEKKSSKQLAIDNAGSKKYAAIVDRCDLDRKVDRSAKDMAEVSTKSEGTFKHKIKNGERSAVVNYELSGKSNSLEKLESLVKPSKDLKLEKKRTVETLPLLQNGDFEEQDLCPELLTNSFDIGGMDDISSDSESSLSSLADKTLSNFSNSSIEDERTISKAHQKHVKKRPDIVQPSFSRNERQKPNCERYNRLPRENEISRRLHDFSDDSSSNRTSLKSVLSVVKVSVLKQTSADLKTDLNTAVKKKTESLANTSCEVETVDTKSVGKFKKEKRLAVGSSLAGEVVKTGVEIKDLYSKHRTSVHSRLGGPLASQSSAASSVSPAVTTNRVDPADTRIPRFGAVRHTGSDNSANVERVDTSDLRNRIRRLDKDFVDLPDCSVHLRKRSKKNVNRNRRQKSDV